MECDIFIMYYENSNIYSYNNNICYTYYNVHANIYVLPKTCTSECKCMVKLALSGTQDHIFLKIYVKCDIYYPAWKSD